MSYKLTCPCGTEWSYRSHYLRHLRSSHPEQARVEEQISPLKSPRRKGKLTWEEIVQKYNTMSVNEIAQEDGTSYVTVLKGLHRLGVKMRPKGSAGNLKPRWTKHGFYKKDLLPGSSPTRQLRWLAITKLGGKCSCGNKDLRVLQINHINGNLRPDKNSSGIRCPKITRKQLVEIAKGNLTEGINVLCANCNIIHEYERGNITDIYAQN